MCDKLINKERGNWALFFLQKSVQTSFNQNGFLVLLINKIYLKNMSQENKTCPNCKKDFIIESDDFDFYEKIKVPAPTFCPDCRFQRRLTFRNDRTLYKRPCAKCGKDVISIYHKDSPYKIYCQSCWWSDDWDGTQFAQDYDFSKPFFEQYGDFMKKVPLMANFIVDESRMENSPYNNMVLDLKNCYLMTDSDFDEDCAYGCEVELSKNCYETNLIDKSEFMYECVNCQNGYRCFFCVDCEASADIWFSRDCNSCIDCFGCVGLRGQKYCFFNEPLSKEEYFAKIKEINLGSRVEIEKIKEKVKKVWENHTYKYMHEKQTDDVSGDYIYNSKNVHSSWIVHEARDVKYSQYLVAPNVKDSYDFSQFGSNCELFYEILQGGNGGSRVKFGWFAVNENNNLEYVIQVMTSKNCFGCISLRSKSYCIFNKQYEKDEYEEMVEKIKKQMDEIPYIDKMGNKYSYGEFFPSAISPFAYNETSAQEYFPLNEAKAMSQGFAWRELEDKNYVPTMAEDKIPDDIKDVKENIVSEIIACKNASKGLVHCATAFRIISPEINFYRKVGLPIPDKCPNCRHMDRMKFRNPPIFREGKCEFDGCDKAFITGYSKDFKGKLYCREHYLQTVA